MKKSHFKKPSKFKKLFFRILKIIAVFFIVVLAALTILFTYVAYKKPVMNRDWQDDSKILPTFSISTSTIEIKNLRDWRYEKDKVVSKNYYTETFDINNLSKAHLLFNPFGQWAGVGHSFFVFEFSDGKTVSVSIEARKEVGEDYGVFKGVLNEYEVWYAFGSAADFLTNRAIYHNEDLYMYPMLIPTEIAKGLFVDLAKEAHKLEAQPGFYNTITSNCTNLLADSANRVKKGSVPFHYSRLFTGYIDNQLYDLGYIRHNAPFEKVYADARIDLKIKELFASSTTYSKEEFWQALK
jgi:hypothetical protein